MGHNYYGEPAWPNDLSYIFPVVILGTIACTIGLAVLEPSMIGEPANPFATPLEILPEWYFFPVFQILRTVPNKLLGVLLMASVPAGSLTVPFLENVNQFQNPFRRPVATTVSLIGTAVALWLGIGAALPIDESLTLGLFQSNLIQLSNIKIFQFFYSYIWGVVALRQIISPQIYPSCQIFLSNIPRKRDMSKILKTLQKNLGKGNEEMK